MPQSCMQHNDMNAILSSLFRCAQNGNRHSEEQIIRLLLPTIQTKISYSISRFKILVSEKNDIVQEALFRIISEGVWNKKFDTTRRPLPWIHIVTINTFYSYVNKHLKKRPSQLSVHSGYLEHLESGCGFENCDLSEIYKYVQQQYPQKKQDVFALYLLNKNGQEIANILSLSSRKRASDIWKEIIEDLRKRFGKNNDG